MWVLLQDKKQKFKNIVIKKVFQFGWEVLGENMKKHQNTSSLSCWTFRITLVDNIERWQSSSQSQVTALQPCISYY